MRWWLYLDVHFLSLTCCQFSWASLFVAESPRVLIFSSSSLCLGTQLTITLISQFPGRPLSTELLVRRLSRAPAPAAARLTTLSSDRYLIGCPPPPRLPLAVGLIKLVTPASYWSRENKITAGTRGFLSLLKWCYKRLASTAGDHKIILKFIEIYYCWCPKHCRISKESS